MITVIIFRVNEEVHGFSVFGHSNYSPSGSDIVCSAVSALAQTAILALKDVAEITPKWNRHDGHLECSIPANLDDQALNTAQLVLKTIITGIENIAQQYPRYVTVSNKEV